MSRRQFVAGALACSASAALHASPPAMRLGGPVFVKSDDPGVLAKAHRIETMGTD